jgi:hypothetical protein
MFTSTPLIRLEAKVLRHKAEFTFYKQYIAVTIQNGIYIVLLFSPPMMSEVPEAIKRLWNKNSTADFILCSKNSKR